MPLRIQAIVIALLLAMGASGRAHTKTVAERLGYPPDSKLLIVHADDLAVAHSVDAASFDALDKNAVTSASVMVPCPWLNEVAAYAKEHPNADLGLHLTLTSEWKIYRWGPVEAKDRVPSLVFAKVAHDYKLPFLAVKVSDERRKLLALLTEKDIVLDSLVMVNPTVRAAEWKEFYVNAIKSLKPGITEMIVHLGHDDAELQAVTLDHPDFGSAWRQSDYGFVTSVEFKKALEENHVILVKWMDLQKLLK